MSILFRILVLILFSIQAQARLSEGAHPSRDTIPKDQTQTSQHPLCKKWGVSGEVCAQRLIRVFGSIWEDFNLPISYVNKRYFINYSIWYTKT